ncbi:MULTISPECIES: TldD/PmbA family protein [unclassified Roseitalea]|uniref:TldD/PmbA family protein n=1 Tax=unclassified Roseitalea TaxID=2639107 RepID=UPI00273EC2E8|nr:MULTISPECIES: TldD/PmbA family protein [unclassified Roseitalea]
MDEHTQLLLDRATRLVEAAKTAGADAADAVTVRSRSRAVTVRNGAVEGTDASESDDMSLRVFVGQRVASVSAAASADATALAERAVAMARVSPVDPYAGLADPDRLARDWPDLDLYDATEVSAAQLTEDALATEAAALGVEGVTKSSGGSASAGLAGFVLVTSHGFSGAYQGTRFGRSVAVIAGEGTAMERDYEFSSRTHFADLEAPEAIGRKAGERTVRRLNPRRMPTGRVTAVLDPRVARSMLGHLSGAINGAAVARKSTFLHNAMGEAIANPAVTVIDDPKRPRGAGSRLFDGEGVAAEPLTMVEDGVLKQWFLSTALGRELGLQTNGRGVRSGTQVNAGSTNLSLEPGPRTPRDLIGDVGTGFYVTEVFGQGVNLVTGEYSRGASGFWIEKGELTHPVSEVTIAGNLRDMFKAMIPASDIDRNFATAAPTLVIEAMTLAGT